jgi:hypothetical protein
MIRQQDGILCVLLYSKKKLPCRKLINHVMKKLFFIPCITFLILTSLLTSCKKDVPLEEAIIGKWQVESYTFVVYKNNVKEQETTIYLKSDEMAVQFAEGSAGIIYESGGLAGNFTWSLTENHITLTFINGSLNWDITVDGDQLEWTYSEVDEEDSTITYEFFYNARKTS